MQMLEVTYNGQSVFRLESDIAISEDPSFDFSFHPAGRKAPGEIKVEIFDSNQRHFSRELAGAAGITNVNRAERGSGLHCSPTLQVGFRLGPPQLFDDSLDLGRIAKQADPPADPAAGLQAESVSACS